MLDCITIDLSYTRFARCFVCGKEGDHRHAVSVNDAGEATAEETDAAHIACKSCHDEIYDIE